MMNEQFALLYQEKKDKARSRLVKSTYRDIINAALVYTPERLKEHLEAVLGEYKRRKELDNRLTKIKLYREALKNLGD